MSTITVALRPGYPVEVHLRAKHAWQTFYHRDFRAWAKLTTGLDLDTREAERLAHATCRELLRTAA